MCKKIKAVKEILKEFDITLEEILNSTLIRIDGGPKREITDSDKLQMIINEWYETSSKLYELKIDLNKG